MNRSSSIYLRQGAAALAVLLTVRAAFGPVTKETQFYLKKRIYGKCNI